MVQLQSCISQGLKALNALLIQGLLFIILGGKIGWLFFCFVSFVCFSFFFFNKHMCMPTIGFAYISIFSD